MTLREARCAARRRWRERNPTYQTEYMRKWRSDPYNRYSEQAKRQERKDTNARQTTVSDQAENQQLETREHQQGA